VEKRRRIERPERCGATHRHAVRDRGEPGDRLREPGEPLHREPDERRGQHTGATRRRGRSALADGRRTRRLRAAVARAARVACARAGPRDAPGRCHLRAACPVTAERRIPRDLPRGCADPRPVSSRLSGHARGVAGRSRRLIRRLHCPGNPRVRHHAGDSVPGPGADAGRIHRGQCGHRPRIEPVARRIRWRHPLRAALHAAHGPCDRPARACTLQDADRGTGRADGGRRRNDAQHWTHARHRRRPLLAVGAPLAGRRCDSDAGRDRHSSVVGFHGHGAGTVRRVVIRRGDPLGGRWHALDPADRRAHPCARPRGQSSNPHRQSAAATSSRRSHQIRPASL